MTTFLGLDTPIFIDCKRVFVPKKGFLMQTVGQGQLLTMYFEVAPSKTWEPLSRSREPQAAKLMFPWLWTNSQTAFQNERERERNKRSGSAGRDDGAEMDERARPTSPTPSFELRRTSSLSLKVLRSLSIKGGSHFWFWYP